MRGFAEQLAQSRFDPWPPIIPVLSGCILKTLKSTPAGVPMALQIANPTVVGKVERLAKRTGLNKTAAVERAVVLVDDLLRLPMFEVVPPGPAETDAAYAAFVAFGRGSGHPAALNFGDVFSYALAKVRSLPLLYKGGDFSETDIASALIG
jgi:ribonuclease VapC